MQNTRTDRIPKILLAVFLAIILTLIITMGFCVDRTPPPDRAALLALFDSTGQPASLKEAGWSSNSRRISHWKGIIVDSNDNVIEINLPNHNLRGEIPQELADLRHLKALDLEGNRLTGEIPKELANLPNLEWIFLRNNRLSGEIPPELGNLPNLKGMDLRHNLLYRSVPLELGNLQSATLDLRDNPLTGCIPFDNPDLYSDLPPCP